MVAGTIARSDKDAHKENDKRFRMIRDKIDNIWEFK
jgi:hypothetical protein